MTNKYYISKCFVKGPKEKTTLKNLKTWVFLNFLLREIIYKFSGI